MANLLRKIDRWLSYDPETVRDLERRDIAMQQLGDIGRDIETVRNNPDQIEQYRQAQDRMNALPQELRAKLPPEAQKLPSQLAGVGDAVSLLGIPTRLERMQYEYGDVPEVKQAMERYEGVTRYNDPRAIKGVQQYADSISESNPETAGFMNLSANLGMGDIAYSGGNEVAKKSASGNNALGLGGWQKRIKDFDAISKITDGEQKDQALSEYLYKWAPSVGYGASPESIDQARRRAGASTEGRLLKEAELGEVQARLKELLAAASAGGGVKGKYAAQEGIPGSYNQNQYAAANYANRIEQAEKSLNELGAAGFNPATMYNQIAKIDNLELIKNPQQKQYAQAMRNFINATLRRESGAAIAKSEFDSAIRQYFANVNDNTETLEQKRQNRLQVLSSLKTEAGGAYNQVVNTYKDEMQNKPSVSNGQRSTIPDSVVKQAEEALNDPNAPEQVKAKARQILQKAGRK